jgi:hypothetical protein
LNRSISLIFGFIIIILGVMIIPFISTYIFGSYVCGHSNMYLAGLVIIIIGIYIVMKENKSDL